MRGFFLLGLISMVDAAKMDCGSNVTICGVLTLETGLGTGVSSCRCVVLLLFCTS